MRPAGHLLAVLALAATAQAAIAQTFDENICTRGQDGIFYGDPFTLSYLFPVTPAPPEEALPANDGLFPSPPIVADTTQAPASCSGGGIVGVLNCVTEEITRAGTAVSEATQPAVDAARLAAAAASGRSVREAADSAAGGRPEESEADIVTMTMTFRPVFHAGRPATMTIEPAGPTDIASTRDLTEQDAQQMAGRVTQQMQVLRDWQVPLGDEQTEAVIDGAPLTVQAPFAVPGVSRGAEQAPAYRMPAACASLFRAYVDRDALRARRGSIAARIASLKEEIARQRKEAGVLGYFRDSEWVDRAEALVARLEGQLAAIDREIAGKDDYIARRSSRLSEEDRARDLEEIRNDPDRLAAEEQRRRDALIAAARDSRKYKWQVIEGEQQYAQRLAAYDALIARAEAEGNDAYADQLRSDKSRLETARDQWRAHTDGIYQSRLNEEQRLQQQNRADGIGPTQDATSLLLSEGQNPIEVLESGAREAAREFVSGRVATDARTLGGAATEDYGLEDFARDLGDSNAEMWKNPELFLERYGSYLQGAGEGARDAVVDLAVLAAEAGDTAGEAFESALSDITGAEFNTFGRENLDTLARAGGVLSKADALAIGEAAGALAGHAGRRLEQMAGRGEAGVREALRGSTGYATASILGAEEVAVAGMLRASRLAGAAGDVAAAANLADAAGDASRAARAAGAAGDASRAAGAAGDAARAADRAGDAARAADRAGDASRLADLPPDATIESDLAALILRQADDPAGTAATAASPRRAADAAGPVSDIPAAPRESPGMAGALDRPATPDADAARAADRAGDAAGRGVDRDAAKTIATHTPEVEATTRIEPPPGSPGMAGALDRPATPDADAARAADRAGDAARSADRASDAAHAAAAARKPDATHNAPPGAPDPDATVNDLPVAAASPGRAVGVSPESAARPGNDFTFYDDPARAPPAAERVQRPLDTDVMDAALDTRPDYPFAASMASLDGVPATGRVSGPAFEINANGKPREIPGRLLVRPDGSNLLLGDVVGTGATATVFTNALDETQVIRLVEHTGGAKPSDSFDLVGRRVAEAIQDADGNGLFRTTRTHDQFLMSDRGGKQWMVTVEENLAHTGGGITHAKQRFAGRKPNAAEELTMALAIRQMNRRGVVWTDHKLANFDIAPNPQSPTGYQMLIFDTGGIRPASGADPIARGRTAQELQRIFDQTPASVGKGSLPEKFVKNVINALDYFDNRVFGPVDPNDLMPSFTPNQINRADHYHDLSSMHHEDLEDLATDTLGREIRIPLQQ